MSDITKTKKQRHVTNVMLLVLAVKQLDMMHVLVVMEPTVYTKILVLTHAQIIITILIMFAQCVTLLVKLVMEEPIPIVTHAMKPLIYKMENVKTIVILITTKVNLITHVIHATKLVKNVSLEMMYLAKNVMMVLT
jgi:hypothetical protein